MNSLRLRLMLLLSVGLGIAWLVAAWFTHLGSREEIAVSYTHLDVYKRQQEQYHITRNDFRD